MNATLGGHNTRAAAETVRAFLAEHNDYPLRLNDPSFFKLADELFRAS